MQKIGFLIIFAGGISNLWDRFYHGAVIDIIHGHSASWNLADIMILVGAVLIMLDMWRAMRQPGRKVLE